MKKLNICVISRSLPNLARLFGSMKSCIEEDTLANSTISLSWNGDPTLLQKIEEMMSFVDHKIFQLPYNFSRNCNALVDAVESQNVLLLNDDIELNSDPITRCQEILLVPVVGAVGLKLLYPDNTIQHAGHVIIVDESGNLKGVTHLAWKKADEDANLNGDYLTEGATAAFLMLRREDYLKVRMNELYNSAFQDVEFSWKLRIVTHKKIVTCCSQSAIHYESQTRGRNDIQKEDVARMATYYAQHKDEILADRAIYRNTIVTTSKGNKQ